MATDMSEEAGQIFLALSLTAVAKYIFTMYQGWRSRTHDWRAAEKAGAVGRVVGMNVFPIKSCAAIAVQQAQATPLGLEVDGVKDRHWLVVTETGDFVTQRQQPRLALVQPCVEGSGPSQTLLLQAPDMPPLRVPTHPPLLRAQVRRCRVWDASLEGQDCGDEAALWFSKLLGQQGLRLLFSAPALVKRDCAETIKPWGQPARAGDQAAFSDFAPYLVVNEASLRQLRTEMPDTQVSLRNFRGNIVVDCEPPFVEDTWAALKIGDVELRMWDPCTRCQMTTVDPDTGVKNPSSEPLQTLKRIRCFPKYGKSPLFGVNAAVDVAGTVREGDPVYAVLKP